jgi:hypothetical protein
MTVRERGLLPALCAEHNHHAGHVRVILPNVRPQAVDLLQNRQGRRGVLVRLLLKQGLKLLLKLALGSSPVITSVGSSTITVGSSIFVLLSSCSCPYP